jgi:hypothetical protein
VLFKKSPYKIKQLKNLQISLHLEYFILANQNKFHVQVFNILFVIKVQENFQFQVSIFIQKYW